MDWLKTLSEKRNEILNLQIAKVTIKTKTFFLGSKINSQKHSTLKISNNL